MSMGFMGISTGVEWVVSTPLAYRSEEIMEDADHTDEYIRRYIEVAEQLEEGDYTPDIPITPPGEIQRLGLALQELAYTLEKHHREL